MIIKFLKNEITKMLNSKRNYILLGFLVFMIIAIVYLIHIERGNILNNSPKSNLESVKIKWQVLHMNSVIFLSQFSTEFIFRSAVPYFLFFMVAFSVESFGVDFHSGNMKFFASISKSRNNILEAKILCLIIYSSLVVIVNLVLGFIISSIAFRVSFNGLGRIIIIYLSSIIPVASFGLIIGIISMFIKNKAVSLTIGFASSIFLTVCDKITVSSSFSPVGIIGVVEKLGTGNVYSGMPLSSLIMPNIVSFTYLILFYFIGKSIFKTIEF